MLNNLLKKTEKERQRAAFIITGIIGVLIFTAWLTIAGFDIKQAVTTPGEKEQLKENYLAFQGQLPSVRQTESVTTELAKRKQLAGKVSGLAGSSSTDKQGDANENQTQEEEQKKPLLERFFEKIGL
jgi:hypothetical protein